MTDKAQFGGSTDYVASQDLMRAVNIAIALEKPLLIKGEPGTGKTMLAHGILNPRLRRRTDCMYMTLFRGFMTASLAVKV